MFENHPINEICFLLPEDAELSKSHLLSCFEDDLKEVYIFAYGFNLDELITAILKLDSNNIPVHCLCDYMQARGAYTWQKLADLHKQLKVGEIILTTAGEPSTNKNAIWHYKCITFIRNKQSAQNWEGSLNFSSSAFEQGNSCRCFISDDWSNQFIKEFNTHKEWALTNQAHHQIDYLLANPISVQDFEMSEDTADLMFELNAMKNTVRALQYGIGFFILLNIIQLIFFVPKIW